MKRAMAVWLIVTLGVATSAQVKDFSGKWVVDRDKTAAANPPGASDPVTSTELLIAMDTKTVTVLSTTRSGQVKNTYNLDGSESKNGTGASVGPGGHPAPAIISTAKWEGAVLVITTKLYQTNATLKYSIDGADLRYEFRNPQMGPGTRTVIYKRAGWIALVRLTSLFSRGAPRS